MGSPRQTQAHALDAPSPLAAPLPPSAERGPLNLVCSEDHFCPLINDVEHLVSYRHHCRLRHCPLRHNAFHARHFIHCETEIGEVAESRSSNESPSFNSATTPTLPLRENYFFTRNVLKDCDIATSGTQQQQNDQRQPLIIHLVRQTPTADDSNEKSNDEVRGRGGEFSDKMELTVVADWSKVTVVELIEYLEWTTGVDRHRLFVVDGAAPPANLPEQHRKVSSILGPQGNEEGETLAPAHITVQCI